MTEETVEKAEDKKLIPIWFDPVFCGIFNDENNIDIVENFLSVYLNIPIEKIKGHVKIKSRKIESKPKKERKKEVDLILDIEGHKYNIEMNSSFSQNIADRNVVFVCRVHGGQLKVGDNTYSNIGETLQINLNTTKRNEKSLVESYYFRNEEGEVLSKKIRIDVVDIERAKDFEYNKSEEKLARWLRIFVSISMDELVKELGDDLMEEESKEKLIDEVEKYNEDEEIIDMYSVYSKQELIHNTLMDEAQEKIEEAQAEIDKAKAEVEKSRVEVEKSRVEAKKAREEKSIEIAKKMLEDNNNIDKISLYTGLSIDQIKSLENE